MIYRWIFIKQFIDLLDKKLIILNKLIIDNNNKGVTMKKFLSVLALIASSSFILANGCPVRSNQDMAESNGLEMTDEMADTQSIPMSEKMGANNNMPKKTSMTKSGKAVQPQADIVELEEIDEIAEPKKSVKSGSKANGKATLPKAKKESADTDYMLEAQEADQPLGTALDKPNLADYNAANTDLVDYNSAYHDSGNDFTDYNAANSDLADYNDDTNSVDDYNAANTDNGNDLIDQTIGR